MMPSPHTERVATKECTDRGCFTTSMPVMRQSGAISARSDTLRDELPHASQLARTFLPPWTLRTLAYTGLHPLRIAAEAPWMVTASGATSAAISDAPRTTNRPSPQDASDPDPRMYAEAAAS